MASDVKEKAQGKTVTRSDDKEVTTVEVVTPAKAQKWVGPEVNAHNRNLNHRKVTEYARDMERDLWQFTGDAICFDVDGVLLNGQHRLHACIMAQKPFKAVVIRNMPRAAQDVMDQGGVRRLSGVLHLRGHINTARLGGALRALVQIEHAGEGYNAYRPTPNELLTLLSKHPRLEESVAVSEGCRGVSPAILSAIHYIGKVLLKDPIKADAFVEVFNSGIPAYPQDPAHLLRENTLRNYERKTKKTHQVQFYAMLRAWNAFRDDEAWGKWTPPRNAVTVKGLKPGMI